LLLCRPTMAPSLLTPRSPPSSPRMAFGFASRAPTPPLKTERPNAPFAPSMMSPAHSYYSPRRLSLIGLKLVSRLHISSTYTPPNPLASPFPTLVYTTPLQTIPPYASSVVSAIPTNLPPPNTKLSPRSVACVFLGYPSSDTKRTIRFCVTPHKGASLYCIYIGSDVQGLDSKQRSKQDLNNNYRNHLEGYRCLDLQTPHVIISHHVVFDDSVFPFSHSLDKPDTYVVAFDVLLELAATQTAPSSSAPPAMHGTRPPAMHGTRQSTLTQRPRSPIPSSPGTTGSRSPSTPSPSPTSPSSHGLLFPGPRSTTPPSAISTASPDSSVSASSPSPPVTIHRYTSPSNRHGMATRAKHGIF
jgi:hypothetical protein